MTMPSEGQEEYKEALASLKLSEKVYILGFNMEARYITHSLAGTPELPPPQLLTSDQAVIDQWGDVGRKIGVVGQMGRGSSREILMPHFIAAPRHANRFSPQRKLKHISNLIVSTEGGAIVSALYNLRDSIDRNTTICLINGGLGVVEHLNHALFRDPLTRPAYILGHMDHLLSRSSGSDSKYRRNMYAVNLEREGRLYLTGLPREHNGDSLVDTWPRIAHNARVQHFVKLLSSAPGLDTVGVPMHKFLRQKLPSVVSTSLSDAISVVVGFNYDRVFNDPYVKVLWGSLFQEAVGIIASLPELQKYPEVIDYFTGHNFMTECRASLDRRGTETSKWIAMLEDGRPLPVNYFNGWFRRRAAETGASHATMRSVETMVRAKQSAKRQELQMSIPMYYSSSARDSDMVTSGGKSRPPVQVVYVNKAEGVRDNFRLVKHYT